MSVCMCVCVCVYVCVCTYVCVRMCVCVCVCVMEVGSLGGGTTVVTHDLHTYYTACMYVITSGHTQGGAAEEDAVKEQ